MNFGLDNIFSKGGMCRINVELKCSFAVKGKAYVVLACRFLSQEIRVGLVKVQSQTVDSALIRIHAYVRPWSDGVDFGRVNCIHARLGVQV